MYPAASPSLTNFRGLLSQSIYTLVFSCSFKRTRSHMHKSLCPCDSFLGSPSDPLQRLPVSEQLFQLKTAGTPSAGKLMLVITSLIYQEQPNRETSQKTSSKVQTQRQFFSLVTFLVFVCFFTIIYSMSLLFSNRSVQPWYFIQLFLQEYHPLPNMSFKCMLFRKVAFAWTDEAIIFSWLIHMAQSLTGAPKLVCQVFYIFTVSGPEQLLSWAVVKGQHFLTAHYCKTS